MCTGVLLSHDTGAHRAKRFDLCATTRFGRWRHCGDPRDGRATSFPRRRCSWIESAFFMFLVHEHEATVCLIHVRLWYMLRDVNAV